MKILKITGIVLAALILIILIGPFFLPAKFHVERSVAIAAPAAAVFGQINNLKNWEKWGPWQAEDPGMTITYAEKVAGPGASYSWTSEKSGNGTLTIIESAPFTDIKNELNFEGMGTSYGSWHFEESENKTTLTWGFDGRLKGLYKWFGLIMERNMVPMMDKGLASIKKIAEEKPKTFLAPNEYSIQEIDFTGRYFVAVRDKIGIDEIHDFYRKNFPSLGLKLASKNIEMKGHPSGLFYDWDEKKNLVELAAAAPVGSKTDLGGEFESVELIPGRALLINYYGAYQDVGNAHHAMEDYLKEKGLRAKIPAIEEYVTDPSTEPDTSKWLTKIYYLVER